MLGKKNKYSVFNKEDSKVLGDALKEEEKAAKKEAFQKSMADKKAKLNSIQKQDNIERAAKIAEDQARTGESPETIQKTIEAQLGSAPAQTAATPVTNAKAETSEVVDTNTDVVNETPEKAEAKKYGKSMYGILDALKAGDIDKGTAAYFMIDALSKFARNTGKDINNIAAAITGGTMDKDYDQSLWGNRKEEMFKNELSGELASQEGSDKNIERQGAKLDLEAKKFANQSTEYKLNAAKMFDEKAKELKDKNPRLASIYSLLAASATSNLGVESYIAAWFANNPESDTKETRQMIVDILGQYRNK